MMIGRTSVYPDSYVYALFGQMGDAKIRHCF